MKVLASSNSLQCTKLMLRAGARELYMGLDSDYMRTFSFTGRGRKAPSGQLTVLPEKEFRESVKLAHAEAVPVFLAANLFYLTDPLQGETDLLGAYCDYVKRGVDLGADAVIVSDIGGIINLRDRGVNVPFHASSFCRTYTVEDALFFKELGIQRLILPHHMRLPEIRSICELDSMEVEVFGYWCCSNVESGCMLWHAVGEKVNFGIFCRNLYQVDDGDCKDDVSFLDAGQDCAICALTDLAEMGVCSVKIFGRAMDSDWVSSCVKIMSTMLDDIQNRNMSLADAKKKLFRRVPWYKKWCTDREPFYRCKYLEGKSRVMDYYV